MAVNPQYNQSEQSSLEDSPSYLTDDRSIAAANEELHLLAEAISLEYPPNPKQINKASLVLTYLLGKGMTPLLAYIDNVPDRSFYLDSFAKEIYLLRFSEIINVYKKSEPIQVPIINEKGTLTKYVSEFDDEGNTIKSFLSENKETPLFTEEIQYSLGTDPRKDIIEYKIRKELLSLIKANPGGIDKLEQMYDARDERTPFSWVRQIKAGYFNVLLGGRDQTGINNIKNKINNKIDLAAASLTALPADTSKDSLNKGSTK